MQRTVPATLLPAILLAFAPLVAGDSTPPELTGFDFTPKTIDVVSASVGLTCTFDVTDDLSGVKAATCLFTSPNVFQDQSCQALTPLTGNRVAGTFGCTVDVPRFVDDGTWQAAVTLEDEVGNSASFGNAELLAGGHPTALTVTSTPDALAPSLTDLVFTPATADVDAATAFVGCDMMLTDTSAGIVDAACQFLSPSFVAFAGCISNAPTSGTRTAGTFSCDVPIPRYAEGGDWLVQVQATDAVGNFYISDAISLLLEGLPSLLTVTSTAPDVTGPTLTDLSLGATSVDVSGGSAAVLCAVDQSDGPAGTAFAACNLSSPSGMQSTGCLATAPAAGTAQLGSYSCSLVIPMFSEAGSWLLTYVTGDKVSNSTLLGPSELAEAGFSSELEVVCSSSAVAQPPVDWSSPDSFAWSPVAEATQYNVYRGALGDLGAGYGDCRNAADPDVTDTAFSDAEVPVPGGGFMFLIGADTPAGEVGLGFATDGTPRTPTPCP